MNNFLLKVFRSLIGLLLAVSLVLLYTVFALLPLIIGLIILFKNPDNITSIQVIKYAGIINIFWTISCATAFSIFFIKSNKNKLFKDAFKNDNNNSP